MTPILDLRQRPLRDLRISVTDRCNLRCGYCMPREHFDKHHVYLARAEILNFEEIEQLTRLFLSLGVEKIRLTGGEPLMRNGLPQLIKQLSQLHTQQNQAPDIALTSNGVLLKQQAEALKQAGLQRLTISLDGLSESTFQQMSDSKVSVQTVLDSIQHTQQLGFTPLKVNMVVKRGVNEHEILPMANYFRHRNVVLRFIEYMDVGNSNGWQMSQVVPSREVLQIIQQQHPLHSLQPHYQGEVAERWAYQDGAGEIGLISSVTQAFCHSCTRVRLSTDGKLFGCLFGFSGLDLRSPLRAGASDNELRQLIQTHWQQRQDHYSEQRLAATPRKKIEMSYIGG